METFPDEKYDLFGDKSVVLFPLHGYSAGMTGVRVGTKDNYLIIAGDGGYGRPSWEELILPGVEWNRKEAMCSLKRLHGERVVLKAQELGISSCWVALTYKKGKAQGTENAGEKRYLVVALGYGENAGADHKVKSIMDVSDYMSGDPDWYKNGLEAAVLAPTAMNQQKFKFERNGEKVTVKVAGMGFYTKIDLGIVMYHFEVGAGKGKEVWGKRLCKLNIINCPEGSSDKEVPSGLIFVSMLPRQDILQCFRILNFNMVRLKPYRILSFQTLQFSMKGRP